ncbi:short-chain dehydrogenase/reductase [Coniochaeta ligniaria NRRL 30616]|uniref:Short-chain dehydrogenase/reductase n=1 Tax=Coniochaeta ligniaria NRRL 30616 TaxID=1408157 RepID=A0A1J7JAH7_9PEZI|nr:short-chain dehydrogenase/reductase [Coniochaeta ligniaria NRRL 30616]
MPSKTVLITGCGPNGIGSALAQEFHMRGHRVFATGRSASEIDPALSRLGMQTLLLDVTSDESINDAVAAVTVATGGRLDILINNAGLLHVMPFADTPTADLRRIMEVNVIGVWAVTRAFLPLLLEVKGLVANLGSINQVFCPPFLAAYNASKAAIEAMGRTLRRELAPFGVRVVTLKTGSVRSGLFDNAAPTVLPEQSLYAPLRDWIESRGFSASARFMEVEDYAEAVVTDLLKDSVQPVIWRGGLVWIAWIFSWFGWETIMVCSAGATLEVFTATDRSRLSQDREMIKGNNLHTLRYQSSAEKPKRS